MTINTVIRDANRVTRMRERERKESQKRGGRERGWKRKRERKRKKEKKDIGESVSGRAYEHMYVILCVQQGRDEGGYFCGTYRGLPV